MIHGALMAKLNAGVSGIAFYFNKPPSEYTRPCCIVESIGEARTQFWSGGVTSDDTAVHEYELTLWYSHADGGPKSLSNKLQDIINYINHFAGTMTDSSVSPNVQHRVLDVACEMGDTDFDPKAELYGQSLFLSIEYVC